MKWLPLHLHRQVHLSSYMFRIIKNTSPPNFMNKFSFISGGSRDGENCNLYTNKSKSLKDFTYLGAKCWNNLPQQLREVDDVKKFSKYYKSQLLHSAINDSAYITNNTFSLFYKPIEDTSLYINANTSR